MAGDYISREAALEITTRTCGDYAAAFAEIRKLPAADVAEVVYAYWIEDGDTQICSNCGEEHEWDTYRASFCDACGAKMDGGAE